MKQIIINFDPEPLESYETIRDFIGARVHQQFKNGIKYPHKAIASDMDMGQSQLTKKISHTDGNRFNLDDLQRYLVSTKDRDIANYIYNLVDAEETAEDLDKEIARLQAKKESLQ